MSTRARRLSLRAHRERDGSGGFTLIELLVVIIIIGILAGIAIPVYLNQRKKAYDTDAKAVLRKAEQTEVGTLTDGATSYSNSVAQLSALEPTATWVDSNGVYTRVTALKTVYVETMPYDANASYDLILGVRSQSGKCFYSLELNGVTTHASSTGCDDPYEYWQTNRGDFH